MFFLLFAIVSSASATPKDTVIIRTIEHLGDRYTIVSVRLGADVDIQLHGGRSGGLTFRDAITASKHNGRQTIALMNGGMYDQDHRPVGLFIRNGEERHAINLHDGDGNFYMKPNGVFWIDTKRVAHVTMSKLFPTDRSAITLATQSGPMLLVDHIINSEFRPDSPNKLRRNGVGVSANGKIVHFVISVGNVRFHDLATLFRDKLTCRHALFLDAVVSKLWTSGNIPMDQYGAVIAVTHKAAP